MSKGLLEEIIVATNLPEQSLRSEMEKLFSLCGVDVQTNDIEQIRKVLARYLQETLMNVKEDK